MARLKRSITTYSPQWDRFIDLSSSLDQPYNNQYHKCYNARLSMLRERCLSNSTNNPLIPRIIELSENEPSTVVGVIVKNTIGRPMLDTAYHSSYEGVSYLGTPFENDDDDVKEPFHTYVNEKDSVVLEDESGRVELEGDFEMEGLASGVVVAIEGVVLDTGVMKVSKLHFPSKPPQDSVSEEISDDVSILLLSGLDCGGPGTQTSLKRELLVDYLTGHFSSEEGSNISRVLIAGGGCTKPIKPENVSPFGNWGGSSNGKKNEADKANLTLPVRELDLFLGELVSSGVPVDYIPGLHDPTNANWPQKPLHPCLLPNSGCFVNMLSRTTNPYKAKIGDRLFVGSDGSNAMDLRRFIAKKNASEGEDEVDDEGNMVEPKVELKEMSPLEAMECVLKFSHIAPTGPDSLPTLPFEGTDPFVIEKTPHVLFAGNCEEFETKMVETEAASTRVICVPSFEKTGQAVILRLKSMDCTVIEFAGLNSGNDDGKKDEKKMEEG